MKAPDYIITRRENPDTKATETAIKGLARGLVYAITKYFDNEENRHEFEDWYLEKYGKPYAWETRTA